MEMSPRGGGQEDGEDKDDTSKTLTLTTNKKTEHPYVSLKPGKSVQLLDAEGNHPETATLRGYNPNESLDTKISEETYSYDKETGVLVVNSNDHSADGLEITVDCGDAGCGYIVFNDNGEMDLGEDDTKYISMWADATIAKVNSKVKVNGPFNKSVVYYSESEGHNVSLKSGEDFTYEDGYLTILNSEYAGMRLTLSANVDGPGAEESWAGFLYLTGDSITDGNPSAGGGQTDTDTTLEVTIDGSEYGVTWLTSTDDNGNTVFTCESNPGNANGDLSATVGEGCTVSYEITASSLTENGWEIQEMEGDQYILDTSGDLDMSAVKFKLSSSGTFMMKETVTDMGGDCTIKVTSSKDGAVVATKTIVIKWSGDSETEE